MANTINYGWLKPTVGSDGDTWGGYLNDVIDDIDGLLGGVSNVEFSILDGATITTAELNVLDGLTATTAELNKLDGVTATTSELNILSGVTATTAELNIMDGVTATTAEINKLDGFTGTVTDLNFAKDLRATNVTAAEFGYLDGVTSNIQTQINNISSSGGTGTVTSITAGSGLSGGTITTTGTISHADTSSQASVNNSGLTFIQDITLDTYGHVTGVGSSTITLPDSPLTGMVDYTAGYTNLNLTSGTSYRNTKSTWIIVYYQLAYNVGMKGEVSANGSTWYQIHGTAGNIDGYTLMVPPGHYYRVTSSAGVAYAVQLG